MSAGHIEKPGFNLSDWALRHRSLVFYLMLVSALAGLYTYFKLGREEDPPFTIKTMIVKTMWPGATTAETLQQVTDRIEKKLGAGAMGTVVLARQLSLDRLVAIKLLPKKFATDAQYIDRFFKEG